MLSACTLSSVELLVTDDESATPLPANSVLYAYKEDSAGLVRADDGPLLMSLNGKVYGNEEAALSVRFVPLDLADTYLLAATAEDGTIYGVAHYANSILDVKIVLGDNVEEAVTAAGLTGASVKDGGIIVTNRTDLNAAIALILDGKLEAKGIPYFVADGPDAKPPATIVRDGDMLKPGS